MVRRGMDREKRTVQARLQSNLNQREERGRTLRGGTRKERMASLKEGGVVGDDDGNEVKNESKINELTGKERKIEIQV
jgi:hypothetical protein